MNELNQLDERRRVLNEQRMRYMDPFVKQEKADIRWLEFERARVQAEISRAATDFLKSNGFYAGGARKPRKGK